jgi:translation initiation factor IF-2
MKTLTELGGSLIRTAAAAIAEARRSLPREERPAEVEAAPQAAEDTAPQVAEAAPQAAEESVADAAGGPMTVAGTPAPIAAAPKPEREVESEAVKAALLDAVARATGLSGDRLLMLRAAVEAAGRRPEDVRLVRVFGVEEQLRGAQKIGEYQYVVDFLPRSMKQVAGGAKDEQGRGGARRGAGRGGGGGRGAKGSVSGGFSMDSLRDDKKSERGGRGRPGGGAAGGGPGKPTGGAPKK